jgi:hypothetical protein
LVVATRERRDHQVDLVAITAQELGAGQVRRVAMPVTLAPEVRPGWLAPGPVGPSAARAGR